MSVNILAAWVVVAVLLFLLWLLTARPPEDGKR